MFYYLQNFFWGFLSGGGGVSLGEFLSGECLSGVYVRRVYASRQNGPASQAADTIDTNSSSYSENKQCMPICIGMFKLIIGTFKWNILKLD